MATAPHFEETPLMAPRRLWLTLRPKARLRSVLASLANILALAPRFDRPTARSHHLVSVLVLARVPVFVLACVPAHRRRSGPTARIERAHRHVKRGLEDAVAGLVLRRRGPRAGPPPAPRRGPPFQHCIRALRHRPSPLPRPPRPLRPRRAPHHLPTTSPSTHHTARSQRPRQRTAHAFSQKNGRLRVALYIGVSMAAAVVGTTAFSRSAG